MNQRLCFPDEFGRRVRGKYDGPKINDYDKFCKYLFITFDFIYTKLGIVILDF